MKTGEAKAELIAEPFCKVELVLGRPEEESVGIIGKLLLRSLEFYEDDIVGACRDISGVLLPRTPPYPNKVKGSGVSSLQPEDLKQLFAALSVWPKPLGFAFKKVVEAFNFRLVVAERDLEGVRTRHLVIVVSAWEEIKICH